jgi:hypothetical protein
VGFLFRRSLFFVKRKADEYCEQLLNVQYTTVLQEWIIAQLKKKNEVLLIFADRITEGKRKLREANAHVFIRVSLRRFRMIALKRDSVCIYEVIAKSSCMSRDVLESDRDSLAARPS